MKEKTNVPKSELSELAITRMVSWTRFTERSLEELERDLSTLIHAIPTSEKRNFATELNMDLMKFREKFDALKKMEVK